MYYNLVPLICSWCKISSRTRGVAVAVRAIIGTFGYFFLNSPNRL